ncbi:FRG domain-containing protein [Ulvibacter antarcticus]|uniref:FRG domain-containing protein n=1 Tax=Ulvibacter antarcticus TaxID=442714 RepID=A0A3L9Z138_9FLAO|nr:FRG domain-containing protein [Ulvibacter antarcticus]RMA66573.1 FRG domain-containing protein [Ulvibacter antarcticus]
MEVIEIQDWYEFKDLVSSKNMHSWIYRGQSNASWPMVSSLSRYLISFKVHKDAWSHQEERLLRIFKRKAHHFLNHLPNDNEAFEWLALMQHFGTPTRLIDFSFSPYVSAFFAIHRTTIDSAVWAIFPPNFDRDDTVTLMDGTKLNPKEMWMRTENSYENNFLPGTNNFLVMGEPEKMNQRLIAQAGTFVVPGVLDKTLESVVLNYYPDGDKCIKKIILKKDIRDEAMRDLYRSNITESTLFPGIDGMARSLAFDLEYHWAYNPKTMKKLPGFDNPPFGLPKGIK